MTVFLTDNQTYILYLIIDELKIAAPIKLNPHFISRHPRRRE